MSEALIKIDHSALRTNQGVIILLLIAAFIINMPWLAGLTALVMLLGTVFKRPGFGLVYTAVLRPSNLVKPDVILDNPEPHRFAQGFGGTVLAGAGLAFAAGAAGLGWGLVWLVIALAALNLLVGFCAGCAVYYWLNRLNVPGFVKAPPGGVFPGMRPKAGKTS